MNKLAIATALLLTTTAAQATTDCTVSLAQYKSLKTGMPYSKAVAALGCEGTEISGADDMVMYMWDGNAAFGSSMTIMVVKGKVYVKTQYGLK